jgi:hypothetical protein
MQNSEVRMQNKVERNLPGPEIEQRRFPFFILASYF